VPSPLTRLGLAIGNDPLSDQLGLQLPAAWAFADSPLGIASTDYPLSLQPEVSIAFTMLRQRPFNLTA